MVATAPFVKLLRQLSDAKDEYRSGALDLEWEGGKASLYFVFGQPNHATFEATGSPELEGDAAVQALLTQMPSHFEIKPWRKQIVRNETITMTSDELIQPFAERTGSSTPTIQESEAAEQAPAGASSEAVPPLLAIDSFPLLPTGEPLWESGSVADVKLTSAIATVSSGLVSLTAPKLRAAGVVVGGEMTDAIWVDGDQVITGELACMALVGATSGTISGFKISEDLARLLPGLWHLPTSFNKLNGSWINLDQLLSDLAAQGDDSILIAAGPQGRCIGLVRGQLQMCYSETSPDAIEGLSNLQTAIASSGCVVTLLGSPSAAVAAPVAPVTTWDGLPETPTEPVHALDWQSPLETEQPEAEEPADALSDPFALPSDALTAEELAAEGSVSENGAAPVSADEAAQAGAEGGLSDLSWGAAGPAAEGQASAVAVQREPLPEGAPDYDGIKADMCRIAVRWLGDEEAKPIAEMINATSNRVESFVTTIDRIRNVEVPNQEQSVVKAMARDMHYYAAEALSGV